MKMKQSSVQLWLRTAASLGLLVAALGSGTSAVAKSALTPLRVHTAGSVLNFNTTKAGTAGVGGVTETMQFKRFDGGLDAEGRISLNIDLSSIDSGIGIRDERMQSMLWNVGQYPSVSFSGQIKPDALPTKAGETVVLEVQGELTMAGQRKPIIALLQVSVWQDRWLVGTRKPIVVKADDFGLTAGVESLRAIMGLNYLSSSVPVTFQLELKPVSAKSDKKAAAPAGGILSSSSTVQPSAW
jgi:polyisoprenoid-binding protein YceI